MKALVVGYGSIGSRHVRLLKELGCRVAVVSRRDIEVEPLYQTVAAALDREHPDYVVIANRTEEHFDTYCELAELGYDGTVLVEKPVFSSFQKTPPHKFKKVFVAYNLRFHPLIQKLRSLLKDETLVAAHTMVGLYLPLWQPQNDYRTGYSAKKAGGGSLRDLSHEVDYSNWLFGAWVKVVARGGHFSNLEIESDDIFSLMLVTEKCPLLTVEVNYLDRLFRREILVNTHRHTIKADLIGQYLQIDREIVEKVSVERDDTYRLELKALLNGELDTLCTLNEALDVVRLIDAAETSSRDEKWVVK